MEEHRRRARRPIQPVTEQPEVEPVQPEKPVDVQATALHAPTQTNAPRRRRSPQPVSEQEPARELPKKNERPVPRLPRMDDGEAAAYKAAPEKPQESRKKRQPVSGKLDSEQIRKAVKASAKAGKTMLVGAGGLLVLVMITAADWIEKVKEAVGAWTEQAKNASHAKKNKPDAQREYELELIKPQDYHGRGQAHAQRTEPQKNSRNNAQTKHSAGRKQPRSREALFNQLATAVLAVVALVSIWQIGSIVMRSVRTQQLNDALSRQHAAVIGTQLTQADGAQPIVIGNMPDPAVLSVSTQQMTPMQDPAAVQAPAVTEQPAAKATDAPDAVKTMKYRRLGGEALPEMAALYEKNRDLIAWVQIPDVLDLPVVYRDNSYYLARDFNRQKNASGTIFLDENHPFKEKTQNLLLHGHNMKDGTMFGRLAQYLSDPTYLRNHPFINFDTLWDKEQYVIFALLNVSLDTRNERFFNYFTHDTFTSDAQFQSYIRQLQLRSDYAIPIDVQPSDALLTLSTCLEEDRLVIVARRLRENETRSELRTLIRMATKQ